MIVDLGKNYFMIVANNGFGSYMRTVLPEPAGKISPLEKFGMKR